MNKPIVIGEVEYDQIKRLLHQNLENIKTIQCLMNGSTVENLEKVEQVEKVITKTPPSRARTHVKADKYSPDKNTNASRPYVIKEMGEFTGHVIGIYEDKYEKGKKNYQFKLSDTTYCYVRECYILGDYSEELLIPQTILYDKIRKIRVYEWEE